MEKIAEFCVIFVAVLLLVAAINGFRISWKGRTVFIWDPWNEWEDDDA